VYLPGDEAVVSYEYAGTGDCPLRTGGGVAAGQVAYDAAGLPPVRYQASCRGTPASGLACEGGGATVVVSPYRGPGSQMTLLKRGGAPPGNTGDFAGTFLAL
jgi:hypothetical protein